MKHPFVIQLKIVTSDLETQLLNKHISDDTPCDLSPEKVKRLQDHISNFIATLTKLNQTMLSLLVIAKPILSKKPLQHVENQLKVAFQNISFKNEPLRESVESHCLKLWETLNRMQGYIDVAKKTNSNLCQHATPELREKMLKQTLENEKLFNPKPKTIFTSPPAIKQTINTNRKPCRGTALRRTDSCTIP